MPVNLAVVLTDPTWLDVVVTGVRRAAGEGVSLAIVPDGTEPAASAEGIEVAVLLCDAGRAVAALTRLRERGARPIPVLALARDPSGPTVSPSSLALLSDPGLADLEIPVPAVDDDATRRRLWDQLRAVGAEDRHHLVEVDARPALDGGPARPEADRWAALAAGAGGVLAGRRAVSSRRWRAEPDT